MRRRSRRRRCGCASGDQVASQRVGRENSLSDPFGDGVLVGRVGGVGRGAERWLPARQAAVAVVYPGGTDRGESICRVAAVRAMFGGGDEFAALQARRGGQFLFDPYRFAG